MTHGPTRVHSEATDSDRALAPTIRGTRSRTRRRARSGTDGPRVVRARRGRHPHPGGTHRFRDLPRAKRVRCSRALRAPVLDRGWDAAAVYGVLSGVDLNNSTLMFVE